MPIKLKETAWKYTLASRKGELLFRLEAFQNVDLVVGVGIVKDISKGENFDVIYMTFGLKNSLERMLVVKKQDARRQIALLKINKYAFVVGYCYLYRGKLIFYATALQAFDTPRVLDVKRGLLDIDEELLLKRQPKKQVKVEDELDNVLEIMKARNESNKIEKRKEK